MQATTNDTITKQRPDDPPLLLGETVTGQARDVTYLCPYYGPARGVLIVTNYKLYFRSVDKDTPNVIEVPLGVVSRIEKVGGASSRGENAYGIEVFCKDMRNLRFAHKQENHSRRNVFEKLHQFAFPLSGKLQLFAFEYSEQFPENGWQVYEPIAELKRMVTSGPESHHSILTYFVAGRQ